jgi:hypothetical protein
MALLRTPSRKDSAGTAHMISMSAEVGENAIDIALRGFEVNTDMLRDAVLQARSANAFYLPLPHGHERRAFGRARDI